MASLRATLEEQIKSAPVVVFSKTYCPYAPPVFLPCRSMRFAALATSPSPPWPEAPSRPRYCVSVKALFTNENVRNISIVELDKLANGESRAGMLRRGLLS